MYELRFLVIRDAFIYYVLKKAGKQQKMRKFRDNNIKTFEKIRKFAAHFCVAPVFVKPFQSLSRLLLP